ncbi:MULTISPECIES: LacI family DNA-binding transcriptional regulator [unclassified Rathayibacter]|nr:MULTISPECIES: LacI family DNA-binding transcriptional regulator [unclassified Rathayibacter]MCJ1675576.1 LacI family transcriptional regulator [Rathayibacter sp. VKM Ac-2929]TCL79521.1 LacI family transcriptional regulator [Rathayibacter sp. PhB192]TCM25210.1 LacI family transcriptional regulator [Rathayibacter sp. PhB179]
MATIKDVAVRAGVALGTASRVLNGSTQTSPESRARVLEAAAALDYVTHGPARALRRSRTDVLGLLVSDIRNPFFSELAHAAEREATKHGYTVLLANANENAAQAEDSLRIFASQRVDGLLLAPQGPVTPRLTALIGSGLPVVLLNRALDGVDVPLFATDNTQGVALILDWLQRRGHSDVAFIGGPTAFSTGAERRSAYLRGRAAHGVSTDDALLEEGDFLADGAEAAMMRILARGVRPTAVFGVNGPTTLGAMRGLHRALGHEYASRVEMISFGDLDWFEYASPRISAVSTGAEQIGRWGAAGVLALIAGEPVVSRFFEPELLDRSGA